MSDTANHLEAKAAEERQRLHSSVAELRNSLSEAVDLKRITRQHLGPACSVGILLGLTLGYAFAGIFIGEGRNAQWHY